MKALLSNLWCLGQIATPASETEMDGGRNEGEGPTGADGDGSSVSGEGDEHQKHNSDTDGGLEAGQIEGDTGMADADADLDVVA